MLPASVRDQLERQCAALIRRGLRGEAIALVRQTVAAHSKPKSLTAVLGASPAGGPALSPIRTRSKAMDAVRTRLVQSGALGTAWGSGGEAPLPLRSATGSLPSLPTAHVSRIRDPGGRVPSLPVPRAGGAGLGSSPNQPARPVPAVLAETLTADAARGWDPPVVAVPSVSRLYWLLLAVLRHGVINRSAAGVGETLSLGSSSRWMHRAAAAAAAAAEGVPGLTRKGRHGSRRRRRVRAQAQSGPPLVWAWARSAAQAVVAGAAVPSVDLMTRQVPGPGGSGRLVRVPSVPELPSSRVVLSRTRSGTRADVASGARTRWSAMGRLEEGQGSDEEEEEDDELEGGREEEEVQAWQDEAQPTEAGAAALPPGIGGASRGSRHRIARLRAELGGVTPAASAGVGAATEQGALSGRVRALGAGGGGEGASGAAGAGRGRGRSDGPSPRSQEPAGPPHRGSRPAPPRPAPPPPRHAIPRPPGFERLNRRALVDWARAAVEARPELLAFRSSRLLLHEPSSSSSSDSLPDMPDLDVAAEAVRGGVRSRAERRRRRRGSVVALGDRSRAEAVAADVAADAARGSDGPQLTGRSGVSQWSTTTDGGESKSGRGQPASLRERAGRVRLTMARLASREAGAGAGAEEGEGRGGGDVPASMRRGPSAAQLRQFHTLFRKLQPARAAGGGESSAESSAESAAEDVSGTRLRDDPLSAALRLPLTAVPVLAAAVRAAEFSAAERIQAVARGVLGRRATVRVRSALLMAVRNWQGFERRALRAWLKESRDGPARRRQLRRFLHWRAVARTTVRQKRFFRLTFWPMHVWRRTAREQREARVRALLLARLRRRVQQRRFLYRLWGAACGPAGLDDPTSVRGAARWRALRLRRVAWVQLRHRLLRRVRAAASPLERAGLVARVRAPAKGSAAAQADGAGAGGLAPVSLRYARVAATLMPFHAWAAIATAERSGRRLGITLGYPSQMPMTSAILAREEGEGEGEAPREEGAARPRPVRRLSSKRKVRGPADHRSLRAAVAGIAGLLDEAGNPVEVYARREGWVRAAAEAALARGEVDVCAGMPLVRHLLAPVLAVPAETDLAVAAAASQGLRRAMAAHRRRSKQPVRFEDDAGSTTAEFDEAAASAARQAASAVAGRRRLRRQGGAAPSAVDEGLALVSAGLRRDALRLADRRTREHAATTFVQFITMVRGRFERWCAFRMVRQRERLVELLHTSSLQRRVFRALHRAVAGQLEQRLTREERLARLKTRLGQRRQSLQGTPAGEGPLPRGDGEGGPEDATGLDDVAGSRESPRPKSAAATLRSPGGPQRGDGGDTAVGFPAGVTGAGGVVVTGSETGSRVPFSGRSGATSRGEAGEAWGSAGRSDPGVGGRGSEASAVRSAAGSDGGAPDDVTDAAGFGGAAAAWPEGGAAPAAGSVAGTGSDAAGPSSGGAPSDAVGRSDATAGDASASGGPGAGVPRTVGSLGAAVVSGSRPSSSPQPASSGLVSSGTSASQSFRQPSSASRLAWSDATGPSAAAGTAASSSGDDDASVGGWQMPGEIEGGAVGVDVDVTERDDASPTHPDGVRPARPSSAADATSGRSQRREGAPARARRASVSTEPRLLHETIAALRVKHAPLLARVRVQEQTEGERGIWGRWEARASGELDFRVEEARRRAEEASDAALARAAGTAGLDHHDALVVERARLLHDAMCRGYDWLYEHRDRRWRQRCFNRLRLCIREKAAERLRRRARLRRTVHIAARIKWIDKNVSEFRRRWVGLRALIGLQEARLMSERLGTPGLWRRLASQRRQLEALSAVILPLGKKEAVAFGATLLGRFLRFREWSILRRARRRLVECACRVRRCRAKRAAFCALVVAASARKLGKEPMPSSLEPPRPIGAKDDEEEEGAAPARVVDLRRVVFVSRELRWSSPLVTAESWPELALRAPPRHPAATCLMEELRAMRLRARRGDAGCLTGPVVVQGVWPGPEELCAVLEADSVRRSLMETSLPTRLHTSWLRRNLDVARRARLREAASRLRRMRVAAIHGAAGAAGAREAEQRAAEAVDEAEDEQARAAAAHTAASAVMAPAADAAAVAAAGGGAGSDEENGEEGGGAGAGSAGSMGGGAAASADGGGPGVRAGVAASPRLELSGNDAKTRQLMAIRRSTRMLPGREDGEEEPPSRWDQLVPEPTSGGVSLIEQLPPPLPAVVGGSLSFPEAVDVLDASLRSTMAVERRLVAAAAATRLSVARGRARCHGPATPPLGATIPFAEACSADEEVWGLVAELGGDGAVASLGVVIGRGVNRLLALPPAAEAGGARGGGPGGGARRLAAATSSTALHPLVASALLARLEDDAALVEAALEAAGAGPETRAREGRLVEAALDGHAVLGSRAARLAGAVEGVPARWVGSEPSGMLVRSSRLHGRGGAGLAVAELERAAARAGEWESDLVSATSGVPPPGRGAAAGASAPRRSPPATLRCALLLRDEQACAVVVAVSPEAVLRACVLTDRGRATPWVGTAPGGRVVVLGDPRPFLEAAAASMRGEMMPKDNPRVAPAAGGRHVSGLFGTASRLGGLQTVGCVTRVTTKASALARCWPHDALPGWRRGRAAWRSEAVKRLRAALGAGAGGEPHAADVTLSSLSADALLALPRSAKRLLASQSRALMQAASRAAEVEPRLAEVLGDVIDQALGESRVVELGAADSTPDVGAAETVTAPVLGARAERAATPTARGCAAVGLGEQTTGPSRTPAPAAGRGPAGTNLGRGAAAAAPDASVLAIAGRGVGAAPLGRGLADAAQPPGAAVAVLSPPPSPFRLAAPTTRPDGFAGPGGGAGSPRDGASAATAPDAPRPEGQLPASLRRFSSFGLASSFGLGSDPFVVGWETPVGPTGQRPASVPGQRRSMLLGGGPAGAATAGVMVGASRLTAWRWLRRRLTESRPALLDGGSRSEVFAACLIDEDGRQETSAADGRGAGSLGATVRAAMQACLDERQAVVAAAARRANDLAFRLVALQEIGVGAAVQRVVDQSPPSLFAERGRPQGPASLRPIEDEGLRAALGSRLVAFGVARWMLRSLCRGMTTESGGGIEADVEEGGGRRRRRSSAAGAELMRGFAPGEPRVDDSDADSEAEVAEDATASRKAATVWRRCVRAAREVYQPARGARMGRAARAASAAAALAVSRAAAATLGLSVEEPRELLRAAAMAGGPARSGSAAVTRDGAASGVESGVRWSGAPPGRAGASSRPGASASGQGTSAPAHASSDAPAGNTGDTAGGGGADGSQLTHAQRGARAAELLALSRRVALRARGLQLRGRAAVCSTAEGTGAEMALDVFTAVTASDAVLRARGALLVAGVEQQRTAARLRRLAAALERAAVLGGPSLPPRAVWRRGFEDSVLTRLATGPDAAMRSTLSAGGQGGPDEGGEGEGGASMRQRRETVSDLRRGRRVGMPPRRRIMLAARIAAQRVRQIGSAAAAFTKDGDRDSEDDKDVEAGEHKRATTSLEWGNESGDSDEEQEEDATGAMSGLAMAFEGYRRPGVLRMFRG